MMAKPKYLENEFQYVGAQQDEEVDIALAPDLLGSDDSDNDNMDDFFQRNKKAEVQKKLNMTQALAQAQ